MPLGAKEHHAILKITLQMINKPLQAFLQWYNFKIETYLFKNCATGQFFSASKAYNFGLRILIQTDVGIT